MSIICDYEILANGVPCNAAVSVSQHFDSVLRETASNICQEYCNNHLDCLGFWTDPAMIGRNEVTCWTSMSDTPNGVDSDVWCSHVKILDSCQLPTTDIRSRELAKCGFWCVWDWIFGVICFMILGCCALQVLVYILGGFAMCCVGSCRSCEDALARKKRQRADARRARKANEDTRRAQKANARRAASNIVDDTQERTEPAAAEPSSEANIVESTEPAEASSEPTTDTS